MSGSSEREARRQDLTPRPPCFVRSLCPVDLESVLLDQGPIDGSPAGKLPSKFSPWVFRFAEGRRPGEPDAMKSLLESLEAIGCPYS
jgi:hypothetical protein